MPSCTLLRQVLIYSCLSLFVACAGGESTSETSGSSSKNDPGSGGGGGGGGSNAVPVIAQSCSTVIKEQAPYQCIPDLLDSDSGDTHTWSFTTLHTCLWLSIDSATGVIRGNPTSLDVGSCTLSFVVNDGKASSSIASVAIAVDELAYQLNSYIKAQNNKGALFLGYRVAISGDLIVASGTNEPSGGTTITNGSTSPDNYDSMSSGAAYIYERTISDWAQVATLKAPNSYDNLKFSDESLDVDGDTVVVAAKYEDDSQTTISHGGTAPSGTGLNDSGAVYVFRRVNGDWVNEAYIKAPNAGADDHFGQAVSISGDILAVGAHEEDNSQTTITNGGTISESNSITDSGAAYIFKRTGSTWAFEAYIKSPIPDIGEEFGEDLALDGDTLVVGAAWDDSLSTTIVNGVPANTNDDYQVGAAHVFRRASNGTWAYEAYLKAPNAGGSDFFGDTVDIDGDSIIVGATWEDNSQTTVTNGTMITESSQTADSGAAYVFTRSGSTWSFQSYLKAPNASASDYLGWDVAISGNLAVVSSRNEDSDSNVTLNDGTADSDDSVADAGAAYVYARAGTNWEFVSYLKAPNSLGDHYFGESVAIDNGTIVVGAPGEDGNQNFISNNGSATADQSIGNSGAVYVYDQN